MQLNSDVANISTPFEFISKQTASSKASKEIDLLYHDDRCGNDGTCCFERDNQNSQMKKQSNNQPQFLRYPACLARKAIEICNQLVGNLKHQDFDHLDFYSDDPVCSYDDVKREIGVTCCEVLPEIAGKMLAVTDEGIEIDDAIYKFQGMGKECDLHETIRQWATNVLALASILPENVYGVDDSTEFVPIKGVKYSRKFDGAVTEDHEAFLIRHFGKCDIRTLTMSSSVEILGWINVRPLDSKSARVYCETLIWLTACDYFGGHECVNPSLGESHHLLTTMGRPLSLVVNSLTSIAIRAECESSNLYSCHIDDKLLARMYETGMVSVTERVFPALSADEIDLLAVASGLFTDAVDLIHDYLHCPSSNAFLPFVVRGYCAHSILLAGYRKGLSIMSTDQMKEKFRHYIKSTMYGVVCSGRYRAIEQTSGCHCNVSNRSCRNWSGDSKFLLTYNGEDYMSMFPSVLIEPTSADRDRIRAKLYAYLNGKSEFKSLMDDADLDAKVGWAWSRLQHTCFVHDCKDAKLGFKRR